MLLAVAMNVIISIIYLLSMSLISRLAPVAHPNVAYGVAIIAWASILFTIQFLLLLLLFWRKANLFSSFRLLFPAYMH